MEKKEINNFVNGMLYTMFDYREYLNSKASKVLNDYERYFGELELSETDLTKSQNQELGIYHSMIDEINDKKNKQAKTNYVLSLTKRSDKVGMAGYVNIFLIVALIVAVGVTIGGILFSVFY